MLDSSRAKTFQQTNLFKHIPNAFGTQNVESYRFYSCKQAWLLNGDKCNIGDWVLFRLPGQTTVIPIAGKVEEILQIIGSKRQKNNTPDAFVLHVADTSAACGGTLNTSEGHAASYSMPEVKYSEKFEAVPLEVNSNMYVCRIIH